MNCFNHHELIAVGVCQDCQKGLCSACASKYSIPICSRCSRTRKESEKRKIYKELFFTFGLSMIATFFIMLNFINSRDPELQKGTLGQILMALVLIYSFSGIVAGWKTLSGITSKVFLFLPIIGWLIYFFLKLLLSTMIGFFMLPIRTFKNTRRLNQLNNLPE
jgi:membrane protease YdiL (CAAX protease family)